MTVPLIRWQFVAEPFYRAPYHFRFGSPVIRWFGAGDVSHVDTIIPDDGVTWAPPGCLYGARADHVGGCISGVWARPPDYAVFSRRIIVTIPVADEQYAAFWAAEKAKRGAPYDRTAIWGFAAGRDWRAPDSWMCSEKQADSAERAGIFRKLFSPANKITPVALGIAVSTLPGVTIEECMS